MKLKKYFGILALISSGLVYGQDAQILQLSNSKIKFAQGGVVYVTDAKNISKTRAKGYICFKLFDKDNFLIIERHGSDINLAPNKTESVSDHISLKPKLAAEAFVAKIFFAEGCSLSQPQSNIEILKLK